MCIGGFTWIPVIGRILRKRAAIFEGDDFSHDSFQIDSFNADGIIAAAMVESMFQMKKTMDQKPFAAVVVHQNIPFSIGVKTLYKYAVSLIQSRIHTDSVYFNRKGFALQAF